MRAPVVVCFELVGEEASAAFGGIRCVLGGESASEVDKVRRIDDWCW
jgi:hypothetical protein